MMFSNKHVFSFSEDLATISANPDTILDENFREIPKNCRHKIRNFINIEHKMAKFIWLKNILKKKIENPRKNAKTSDDFLLKFLRSARCKST